MKMSEEEEEEGKLHDTLEAESEDESEDPIETEAEEEIKEEIIEEKTTPEGDDASESVETDPDWDESTPIGEDEDKNLEEHQEAEKESGDAEADLDAEIMADLEDFDADGAEPIKETETPESTEPPENMDAIPDLAAEAAILAGQDLDHPERKDTGENGEPREEEGETGEAFSSPELEAVSMEEERLSDEGDEAAQKKNIVEGALFVAGRPVSLEELNIKTEIRKRDLAEILKELAMDYLMRSTSLEIVQIQDKFSLQIKPEYTPNVKKFASGGLIPDKHLKTLTIIALKQPLLKSTLVKIRGSGAYDHVKFLLDRGFIEARRKGRSAELTTTEQFADTFGLSRDLPTLKQQMITQLGIPEK